MTDPRRRPEDDKINTPILDGEGSFGRTAAPGGSSVTVGDFQARDSAVAIGAHASAENRVQRDNRTVGQAELEDLRAALVALLSAGGAAARPAGISAATLGAAVDDVDLLEAEVSSPGPRAGVITRLLADLAAGVGGVAGVGEALERLTRVLGPVVDRLGSIGH